MALAPGTSLGRYTIERSIGSGGAGEVYAAKDEQLDRRVALKLLRWGNAMPSSARGAGPDSDPKSRIVREARAAAALTHPNCISIFDVGELDVQGFMVAYLAMELVDGHTLRTYVGDEDVSLDDRIGWLADLARALNAAHSSGMVHRDVKPENVMIRRDGVLKVLDFGVAKRARAIPSSNGMSPATSHGGIPPASVSSDTIALGTVVYMAPEQVRGERLDGRTDQFAWGVVAYELLSGALPWAYTGDPVHYVLEMMSTDAPPIVSDSTTRIPDYVEATILRALSRNPDDRFPSMSDVLTALGMGTMRARELSIPPSDSSAGSQRLQVETPSFSSKALAGIAAAAVTSSTSSTSSLANGLHGAPTSSAGQMVNASPDSTMPPTMAAASAGSKRHLYIIAALVLIAAIALAALRFAAHP